MVMSVGNSFSLAPSVPFIQLFLFKNLAEKWGRKYQLRHDIVSLSAGVWLGLDYIAKVNMGTGLNLKLCNAYGTAKTTETNQLSTGKIVSQWNVQMAVNVRLPLQLQPWWPPSHMLLWTFPCTIIFESLGEWQCVISVFKLPLLVVDKCWELCQKTQGWHLHISIESAYFLLFYFFSPHMACRLARKPA